jgi:hypothetical protein
MGAHINKPKYKSHNFYYQEREHRRKRVDIDAGKSDIDIVC